jgi:YggT family protein
MIILYDALQLILGVAYFIIIAHVIMSWLINFQVLNLNQQLVSQIWYMLQRILDPLYSRVRRFMPNLGGVDLTPLVVLLAVYALRIIIQNNMAAFY